MYKRICWCGNNELLPFNAEYGRCEECGTLVSVGGLSDKELQVSDDDKDFYGKQYWLEHQSEDLGFANIFGRARSDLTDRNLHWLRTLLRYQVPPANVLELGCSHGSFVGLMRQAGYDASGVELSPWVVEFGQKTFDVPIALGPAENLNLIPGSFDLVVLMDVLEHLPDPEGTMRHALGLLKPEGMLIIQTPEFKEEMTFEELTASQGAFLKMLQPDEHVYLFTKSSVKRLFNRLGADNLVFEPPVFYQYDMFFLVGRQPIEALSDDSGQDALASRPTGRFVQAMLDLDSRIKVIDADRAERLDQINTLSEQIKIIDADRADRLEQINTLTRMIRELQASVREINS
ncbi:class I SAM-dependent methyltransferase [Rhizobium tubonense]|uniref:Methyltransferase type 11 n=1 Tax=Rhizobium tubonense TaxID=484088 RepID=A0A2W4CQ66_9HYPH|nr:class I SAM-dependent methyltransferase [Rhizobium tubonense]PZM14877.1 hypothetical protein CPY51_09280 [Rhizobium tubonense]